MTSRSKKSELRRTALAKREQVAAEAGGKAALMIARRCLGDFVFMKGAIVAGYAATKGEVDPFPLMVALSKQGHPLCLPHTDDAHIVFRSWKPGDPLVVGRFNILEPDEKAKERRPHLILVPLLAFDRRGFRLGYGGGYYDRYLRQHRANGTVRAVGLAYDAQLLDELPREETDEPLDAVITESRVIRFERD